MSRDAQKHREQQRAYRQKNLEKVKQGHLESRNRHYDATRARRKAWKLANAERQKEINRASYLKARYNLTPEQYDEMLAAQGGVCAICGRVNGAGKRLAIDHDHATGRVRGLLCNFCNMGLAVLDAYPEQVRAYLGWTSEGEDDGG